MTPLDGVTRHRRGRSWTSSSARAIETSNETYAYRAPGFRDCSRGGTGIIGFESGVLLTSGDVANVVGPNLSDSIADGSTRACPATPT